MEVPRDLPANCVSESMTSQRVRFENWMLPAAFKYDSKDFIDSRCPEVCMLSMPMIYWGP